MVAAARGWRYAIIAVILFGAADLGQYGLAYVRQTRPVSLPGFIAYIRVPPGASEHRLYCAEWSAADRLIMRNLRLASGYAGLFPRKDLDYNRDISLSVAGVQWRTEGGPPPQVWLKLDPLPRARLVCRAVESADPDRDLDKIDVVSTALVQDPLDLPPGEPGAVSIVSDRPGRIRLATKSSSRQLLVVSESYHPGWEAQVDGAPSHVFRVYGDFMGCALDAGEHQVEFVFRPESFELGKAVSFAGLGALVLAFALVFRWSRSAGKRP